MIFNSLIFIFICFIPCILCILLTEKMGGRFRIRIQNGILLIFSLLFFAWSGTQYIKVLVFLILLNYILGRLKSRNKYVLILGVILNLGVLFYYKYLNLIITTYNSILQRDFYLWKLLHPWGFLLLFFNVFLILWICTREKRRRVRIFLISPYMFPFFQNFLRVLS